jgi:hypothetical protein
MHSGWKISARQIWKENQAFLGQRKVWKLIKEAMDGGYIRREYLLVGNLRKGVKYYLSETPNRKNSNNVSDAAICGAPKTEASKSAARKKDNLEERTLYKKERTEPIRTEEKNGSDRIGSDGSPSFQKDEEQKKIPTLEEIEMVVEHAAQRKIGLKHSDIRAWVNRYGLEKTIHAVDLAIEDMKSGSLLVNPPGWITNALKKYV